MIKKYFNVNCSFCRSLLNQHGEDLGLDPKRIPSNSAVSHFVEAFAKAWNEYNNPRLDFKRWFLCFFYAAAFTGGFNMYFTVNKIIQGCSYVCGSGWRTEHVWSTLAFCRSEWKISFLCLWHTPIMWKDLRCF